MDFKFKDLPYASDSLEPFIDKTTMETHHGKHHRTYYDNFIKAIKDTPQASWSLPEIFSKISTLPAVIRNNGGGHYNHGFFWDCMGANGLRHPTGQISQHIDKTFGSYEALIKSMTTAGLSRFGSGFVWLIMQKNGTLSVISTPNQNNPLMGDEPVQGTPLMAIDVWEHAYYLRYQNSRIRYLDAFWNVVDWKKASALYDAL
ncbi:MAG: superoxide dismutase [SAR324 cluster bacterium]|nr:superoxide dismutase [SAR324 cluster bacterium]